MYKLLDGYINDIEFLRVFPFHLRQRVQYTEKKPKKFALKTNFFFFGGFEIKEYSHKFVDRWNQLHKFLLDSFQHILQKQEGDDKLVLK